MAEFGIGSGQDALLDETLGRLSKKPGVRAAIALDRASGAILKTSGQISAIGTSKTPVSSLAGQAIASFSNDPNAAQNAEFQGAEELAGLVWNFVNTAGNLVQELDTEDELKLLRLRTRRQELVIVPDAKYLLIAVHDTAPA